MCRRTLYTTREIDNIDVNVLLKTSSENMKQRGGGELRLNLEAEHFKLVTLGFLMFLYKLYVISESNVYYPVKI